LLTGLHFGDCQFIRPSVQNRLRDTYLGGQNLTLKDFFDTLDRMDRSVMPDEDVVKLALFYVLERFFMGRDKRRLINLDWLSLVDDMEQFNAYPWGSISYTETLDGLQSALRGRLDGYKKRKAIKPSHDIEKYHLKGCPYVFQVIPLYIST
jgi:hypothetical protein